MKSSFTPPRYHFSIYVADDKQSKQVQMWAFKHGYRWLFNIISGNPTSKDRMINCAESYIVFNSKNRDIDRNQLYYLQTQEIPHDSRYMVEYELGEIVSYRKIFVSDLIDSL
jgi:hypothetical protein